MASSSVRVFRNCLVWQWGPSTPRCGGVAKHVYADWFTVDVVNGVFGEVGLDAVPEDVAASCVESTDLGGAVVIPGLIDSHIHVGMTGETVNYADLSCCDSIEAWKDAMRAHSQAHPKLAWLIGTGWDQTRWGGAPLPSREDLDAAVGDRLAFAYRNCWHIGVASTAALTLAGLGNPTLPGAAEAWAREGGAVDADAQGRLTGVVREACVELVTRCISEETFDVRVEQFAAALAKCAASGLTAVQSNDRKAWDVYARLQDEGRLPLRVFLTPDFEEVAAASQRSSDGSSSSGAGEASSAMSRVPAAGEEVALLSCHRVKLFADGSLGAETAALKEPYVGSENRGILMHTPEELARQVKQAKEWGYRVEVHAIGDRAAAEVLRAFRAARLGPEDRPIITHAQVLDAQIIADMAELGVVVAIQPSFVPTDANFVRKRLSQRAQQHSYVWATLMRGSDGHTPPVLCAGGSDAPVETLEPLVGVYEAMTRQRWKGKDRCENGSERDTDRASGGATAAATEASAAAAAAAAEEEPFKPEECLTLDEALWLYTVGAATAAGEEKRLGRIAPGYLADFVVLDPEAVERAPAGLATAAVRETWVHGMRRSVAAGDQNEWRRSMGCLDAHGKNGPKRRCCGRL